MSDDVASPCTDLCIMDGDICTGCGMTNQEITKWPKMTNEDRQKVLDRLEATKAAE